MAYHPSIKTYLGVFLALLVLTGVTVWVAYLHLGAFNDIVAMSIAVFKATLVILFFMHIKGSSRVTKMAILSGVFWLVILFVFLLSDYLTRNALPGGMQLIS